MIAPSTDSLFTLLLILDAVPYSSANIRLIRDIWSFGGMMREIMLVPFLERKVVVNNTNEHISTNKEKTYQQYTQVYFMISEPFEK